MQLTLTTHQCTVKARSALVALSVPRERKRSTASNGPPSNFGRKDTIAYLEERIGYEVVMFNYETKLTDGERTAANKVTTTARSIGW